MLLMCADLAQERAWQRPETVRHSDVTAAAAAQRRMLLLAADECVLTQSLGVAHISMQTKSLWYFTPTLGSRGSPLGKKRI